MENEVLTTYLKKVNEQYRTGIAKEHAYRGALGEFVNALLPQLLATNEPVHVACGAPDFAVCDRKSHQAVFYIEAKDVGDGDLDGCNVHREQFDRYRQGLSLVIFTDYLDFHFYRGETLVEKVRIAEEAGGRIRPVSENHDRFAALLADFAAATPEKIKSPSRLAALMAAKALKQAVYDSYESVQWRVCRSDIGTVQLSRSGINDSLYHGFGRMKIAAFAALPQLIARGMTVRRSENWKGRGYDSVVLVAPVEIGSVAHCALIIVNSMKDGGYRFYLHEVGRLEDIKKAGGMRTGFADRSVLSRTPGSVKSLAFSLWAVNGDSKGEAVTTADSGNPTPERVFDYIYAVLHDVGYREKYREFLKVDFPRIPYPTDRTAFERLADLGAELRELHLMKRHAPRFGTLAAFPVAGTNAVDGAKWADGRVWINGTQCFDGKEVCVSYG